MIVKVGDRVRMKGRRGKIVDITSVPTNTADPELQGEFDTSMPDETIFIGRNIETGGVVISDMSEIALVVDKQNLV